jgi:hypothetical protein
MNLFELRIVLRQLRHELECPNCKKAYPERKIRILGTTLESGAFLASCTECSQEIIVNVTIERRHRKISTSKRHYWKIGEKVSADEVLDMRNFLGQFNGDLTKLITTNKK